MRDVGGCRIRPGDDLKNPSTTVGAELAGLQLVRSVRRPTMDGAASKCPAKKWSHHPPGPRTCHYVSTYYIPRTRVRTLRSKTQSDDGEGDVSGQSVPMHGTLPDASGDAGAAPDCPGSLVVVVVDACTPPNGRAVAAVPNDPKGLTFAVAPNGLVGAPPNTIVSRMDAIRGVGACCCVPRVGMMERYYSLWKKDTWH